MTPARFKLVRMIFDQVADAPAGEWDALVGTRCAGDAELRAQVERLLHQSATPSMPVDASPHGESFRAFLDGIGSAKIPGRVGRFRVLRLIGQGGMGAVYEAEQDNPRRSIALKIIRPGYASESALRRFEHEAQILGRLQHPGIACIHEAGVADIGAGPQPYLAMELIRGSTLSTHLQSCALSVHERLELFALICDGVQHAHSKGVIHRDLKPANILIDEAGRPRIVDFGVARAATSHTLPASMHTLAGQIIGTINYMSPEQVAGNEADARSDIYSLGAILFEMLSARLPHDLKGRSLPEAARIVRDEEPSHLASISTEFRGDLETIVSKAIDKAPSRRYRSADELAADVRRFLQDLPILARPASAAYQLRKFARRQKGLVLGVAFAFVILLVALATVSWFAVRESRERRRAQEQEARAQWTSYRNCIAAADRALQLHDVAAATRLLDSAPQPLRGWEWRYLSHILDRSVLTIQPTGGAIRGIVAGPDADSIISASDDGSIRRWNISDSGKTCTLIAREPEIENIVLSPDRLRFLTGRKDGSAAMWDVHSGSLLWRFAGAPGLHEQAFTPDGSMVAVPSTNRVVLLDALTGRANSSIPLPVSGVKWPAIDSSGQLMACRIGESVVTFDLHGGAEMWRAQASAFRFSSDATKIWLYSDWANAITVADPRTGRKLAAIDQAHGIMGASGGRWLASFQPRGSVDLRDADDGRLFATLDGHTSSVTSASFSRDDSLVVTGASDGSIKVWDPAEAGSGFMIPGSNDVVLGGALAPDGARAATVGWTSVKMWDVATGAELWTSFPSTRELRASAFSPDGLCLAVAGTEGVVAVLDVAEPRIIARSLPVPGQICALAWTLDGRAVLAAGTDGGLYQFDGRTAERARSVQLSNTPLEAMAVSPSDRQLAFGCADGRRSTCSLDEVFVGGTKGDHSTDLPPLAAQSGRLIPVSAFAYGANGDLLAAGSSDGTVSLWDTRQRRVAWTASTSGGCAKALAFCPDGTRLMAGFADASVHVLDAATGDDLLVMRAPWASACSLGFSADGNTLVVISTEAPGGCALFESAPPEGGLAGRQRQRQVRRIVDDLFRRVVFYQEVLTALDADRSLSESVRQAARRLAMARGDHPSYLNSQAWVVVRHSGQPDEEYELALRKAQLACEMRPGEHSFLNTLGVAQFRTNRSREAVATLSYCIQQFPTPDQPQHAIDLLVLAMAHASLGHTDEARLAMRHAQALMPDDPYRNDAECAWFLSEAQRSVP